MSNKHKHNSQIKQCQKDMRKIKRSNNQPLLIVVLTSLDGGEGGGGMILTGLGPPPRIFLFLEVPEGFFFETARDLLFVVSIKAWSKFCNTQ